MTAYRNLPWKRRLEIMRTLEASGSEMHTGHVGDGFTAAIGREALGNTEREMLKHGFQVCDLVYFPLGTDKPKDHLRHDSLKYGVKACNWLFAKFEPIPNFETRS